MGRIGYGAIAASVILIGISALLPDWPWLAVLARLAIALVPGVVVFTYIVRTRKRMAASEDQPKP